MNERPEAPQMGADTVGALRRRIARTLADAFAARGYDGTPALDARLLVAQALGIEPGRVPLVDERVVTREVEVLAEALAGRRAAGEPVARILGTKEFHGLEFRLSPETLVPRADTETVVDAALAEIDRSGGRDAALTVLDLGTGTGAILLALLASLPGAMGVGIDLAPRAVSTARDNARRLGLAERARFIVGDWMRGIDARFDIVTANPPYVESATIDSLAVEVRRFDPHLALDGGSDGLSAIRAILADLSQVLAEGGKAFVEIGAGQAATVARIAAQHGFLARFVSDLGGIERVAVLERSA